jgi:hypothetical protein
MPVQSSRRFNGALAIQRGPLIYALKIGEAWQRIHEEAPYRDLPHADWEVYPTTPWNYALAVDETDLSGGITFERQPIGNRPFSPEEAPISASVKGKRIPEWQAKDGVAGDAPASPVDSEAPLEELTLIPYGCTNLRITEFPTLKKGKESS